MSVIFLVLSVSMSVMEGLTLTFAITMQYPEPKLCLGGISMEAYCMKCRAKKEMKSPKKVTMKNGKPATSGVCPKCGTKMFRIGKS